MEYMKKLVRALVLIMVLTILLSGSVRVRAQAPHLTGKVSINLKRGILSANMCLARLPKTQVSFVLNHGFNVKSVRNGRGDLLDYRGYYDGHAVGEGLEYTLSDPLGEAGILCVTYTGAFPDYGTARNDFDFKGMIAFDGRTLRATEQSKWYPILYDAKSDHLAAGVSYQLSIDCPDCAAAYVNGDQPRRGKQTQFASAAPCPLFLFAGDFTFSEVEGVTYINGTVTPQTAKVIGTTVKNIMRFYEGFFGVPYQGTPTFLTFESIDRHRPAGKNTLTFASYPTIAFDGLIPFDSLVDTVDGKAVLKELPWHTIAHELAHYYFGTLLVPTGNYHWFYVESTAEYMALIGVRHFLGDTVYRRWVDSYSSRVSRISDVVSLDRVSGEHMDSGNWYFYWPLLLLSLEKEAGIKRMRSIMATILKARPDQALDYGFLRQAAMASGLPENDWQRFEQRCVHTTSIDTCVSDGYGTPLH